MNTGSEKASGPRRAPASPLPSYGIDTYSMPLDEAWRTRRAVYEGTFRFEKADSPGGGARARTAVTFLEDLLVATFQGEAHAINRSADLIAAHPTPVLKVRIYHRGECLLVQGEAQTRMGVGAIHFIDHNRPHRQIGTEMEHSTLGLPYHAVGYDPMLHPAYFNIPLDSPRGRLLHVGLASLFDEVRTLDRGEAAGVAMAIKGLVRGVIAGGIGPEASDHNRHARTAAMKAFIDQNLAEPDLGIDMLLEKFGASRATVYRDFADDGGLKNFILSRRLHRAYRALSEAMPTRGAVLAVAEACGFETLAHFSRSFRAHFGERPSDVLGQWQTWTPHIERSDVGDQPTDMVLPTGSIAALRWSYDRFN
ncbi:AraC family transcriptional regulator [Roseibacterium sp. SDUM158016]|uniref:helix-turn-helix domain-containing protein n=1 Tax=Roseicyclus sediminis TaxID=2980997 RepID=UPI0021D325C0|nr:AraC family transcriptional regulator [Roseibacterium sp. SDUM158016]MCU4652123.1 AraC family transcriptional regulator [Roseibacterium sp. SDUM158016]